MSQVTPKKKWPTKSAAKAAKAVKASDKSAQSLASEVLTPETLDAIASYIDRSGPGAQVVALRRDKPRKKAA